MTVCAGTSDKYGTGRLMVPAKMAREIVPGKLIAYESVPPVAGAENSGQAAEYPENLSCSLTPGEIGPFICHERMARLDAGWIAASSNVS